ncbi:MAG: T9SS type A sorting domain-containing protein [Bacteroidia bacterium]
MKKIYLIVFVTLINFINAQTYTVTEANHMIAVGDTSRFYSCDTGAVNLSSILSATGSNISWNFTGVTVNNTVVTTPYNSTISVASATSYPGCNIVQGTTSFFKNSTGPAQVELVGASMMGASLNFTNTAKVLQFPFALNNTFTDNFSGTVTFTSNGTFSGSVTVTADGNGTLVLPTGQVFNNVTRVKTKQTTTINGILPLPLPVTLKITNYDYYHVSDLFPVFTISYNSIVLGVGSPTVTGTVRSNKAVTVVGISENILNENSFNVYPNPTNEVLNFNVNTIGIEPKEISIISLTGKVVYQSQFQNSINLNQLKPGLYLLQVKTNLGNYKKKLIIN